jgi:hypothetical protein
MADLTFTVRASRGGAPLAGPGLEASLSLSMPDMTMVENRVRLAPAGPGAWTGRGVIVRCPSGGRRWSAQVDLSLRPPPGGSAPPAPLQATFTFELAP